jgi:hypothetical protein
MYGGEWGGGQLTTTCTMCPCVWRVFTSVCDACIRLYVLQIRSLRSRLKESRASVEQLTTELSSLKISMHEREAEMTAALRSSTDRLHLASSGPGVCREGGRGVDLARCCVAQCVGGGGGADCSIAQQH